MRIFVLCLVLMGCKGVDPYIASGTGLEELGVTFLESVDLWKEARDDGLVSALEYEKWKEFGERFKLYYPIALRLWDTARKVHDQSATDQMSAILKTLSQEFAEFLIEVSTARKTPQELSHAP